MHSVPDLETAHAMPHDMSDEEMQRREAKEDICWRVCLVLGCALLLGAVWLS